jgi:hypothetical protein
MISAMYSGDKVWLGHALIRPGGSGATGTFCSTVRIVPRGRFSVRFCLTNRRTNGRVRHCPFSGKVVSGWMVFDNLAASYWLLASSHVNPKNQPKSTPIEAWALKCAPNRDDLRCTLPNPRHSGMVWDAVGYMGRGVGQRSVDRTSGDRRDRERQNLLNREDRRHRAKSDAVGNYHFGSNRVPSPSTSSGSGCTLFVP